MAFTITMCVAISMRKNKRGVLFPDMCLTIVGLLIRSSFVLADKVGCTAPRQCVRVFQCSSERDFVSDRSRGAEWRKQYKFV